MARTQKKPKPTRRDISTPSLNGQAIEVFTLGEAAEYLRLAMPEVLRLIEEEGLPARLIGEEWKLLRPAIEKWLSAGSPSKQAQKEGWLAMAGKYADDPDLEKIVATAYRRRGRTVVEDREDAECPF